MSDPKVICVKGGNSNWYEQAIFIINKNNTGKKVPVDLVAEAERIIGGYFERPYGSLPVQSTAAAKAKQKSRRRFDITMNIIMLVCCLVLAGVLFWNFL